MPHSLRLYSTLCEPPPFDFPISVIERRERSPELWEELAHLTDYVNSLRGDDESLRFAHLFHHIRRVRWRYAVQIEPEALRGGLAEWLAAANAIMNVEDGSVRDFAGRKLATPGGPPDEAAVVAFPPAAIARKERSQARLARQGVPADDTVPPVPSELEVLPRSAHEVAGRSLALFIVASRAECLHDGLPLASCNSRMLSRETRSFLTPLETAFENARSYADYDLPSLVRHFEAIVPLHWALGLIDELPFPDRRTDMAALAQRCLTSPGEKLLSSARLRPLSQILDALDEHVRMHYAAISAWSNQQPIPASLNPAVVSERARALAWLVSIDDVDWDELDPQVLF